jgi:hypothetical protein
VVKVFKKQQQKNIFQIQLGFSVKISCILSIIQVNWPPYTQSIDAHALWGGERASL